MSLSHCCCSDDPQNATTTRRAQRSWAVAVKIAIAGALVACTLLGSRLPNAMAQGAQVLQWTGAEKDPHPCLYVTAKDLARAKQTRKDLTALTQGDWNLEGDGEEKLIAAALVADNAAAQRVVIKEAIIQFDGLIKQIPSTTVGGVGPHAYARGFGRAVGLADAALASPLLSPDERKQLLEKIALTGYLMNDPKYWNPQATHGSLCPNMFTSAALYRLAIAALIPSHPMAKQWFDGALKELKGELESWVDLNGGVAETPHYSMVIVDQWLGAFVIARNAGAPNDGFLFDPNLKKAMQWFGNISTPRDPRNGGLRRWPTVGHTYVNERTSTFGMMANLWREKDPDFAAQMQWMNREHGSFNAPGILSYYPAFMGYRWFFTNDDVNPKTPAWTSNCYPETGVLLRNVLGSNRETTLYMIAGRNHSHYFNDSGSITIWGKGSELCDEDSYQFRRNPVSREAHSMPDKPTTLNEERVMAMQEFSTTKDFDYTSGIRRGWQRQIAFVKDTDPQGPNYFVIADTLNAKSVPTIWRLFIRAAQATVNGQTVTVTGKEDVDMDVIFVSPNALTPEIKTDHIAVPLAANGTLLTVVYPRLRTDKPPQVTPLANGKGVKVVTPSGTDFILLNPEPFTFNEGNVTFTGKAGLFKLRDGKLIKSLPGECPVTTAWLDGDRELRAIRWDGPQYPIAPDE